MVKIQERIKHRFNRLLLDVSNECAKWQVPIEEIPFRVWLLRKIGLKIQSPVFIDKGFMFEHGENITIGAYTSIRQNAYLGDWGKIDIGMGCWFAKEVTVVTGGHNTYDHNSFLKPVSIGDFCFIGAETTILAGAKIGEYSFIGAGSLVVDEIPPMSIAFGRPAKVIKIKEKLPDEMKTAFGFVDRFNRILTRVR